MVQSFNYPTAIRFGAGAIQELPAYLKKNNLKRPLLVADGVIVGLDFFKKIVTDLKNNGTEAVVYSKMHKNPVKSDVMGGVAVFHAQGCDSIIGLGGGVPMDVARAIALKTHHERDLFDYEDASDGWQYVTEAIPHFITVPTTSGTGSEVGRSTVISTNKTHQKKILFSPRLMAKMVFADPELTKDLPAHITAATGMDTLTHNLEAYLAKGYNPLCDGIALEGISLCAQYLEMAVNKPNLEARTNMMAAALMGGTAFQKGLGVVHSLAHPLSTMFDTHHGLANAIMLQYGMAFNADTGWQKYGMAFSTFKAVKKQENRFKRIAQALNLRGKSSSAVVNYLKELNPRIGLPTTLGEIGVTRAHIAPLAELALADACHPSNPRPVSLDNFKLLYQRAL